MHLIKQQNKKEAMKKNTIVVIAMLLSISVFGQPKDTIQIQLSDTYITSIKGDTISITLKEKKVSIVSQNFTALDNVNLNEIVSTIYNGKKASIEIEGAKISVEPKNEVSFPMSNKIAVSPTDKLNDLDAINLNDIVNEKLAMHEGNKKKDDTVELKKTMSDLELAEAQMEVERSKMELRRAEIERKRAEIEARNENISEREEAEIDQIEEEIDQMEDEIDNWEDRLDEKMEALEAEMELIEEILERKIEERERKLVVSVDGVEVTDSLENDNVNVTNIGEAADIVWDTAKEYKEKKKKKRRTVGQFDVQLALNNFVDDGALADGTNYDLDLWGSRYLGLKYSRKTRLFGENSKLYFKYGLELGWNNYQMAGNFIAQKGADATAFVNADTAGFGSVSKSKLENTYLSIPIMFQLDFSKSPRRENGFNIGIGGYVGIRTNTHTNFEYKDLNNDDSKLVVKNSHFVNDLRYGLEMQIGGLWGINLFAKYDLSTLFIENRGPEINVITFGITI